MRSPPIGIDDNALPCHVGRVPPDTGEHLAVSHVHAQVMPPGSNGTTDERASTKGPGGTRREIHGKTLTLFWKLLRYRVAVMVIIFTLLGASS
jgi:hypothetical protein